MLDDFNRPEGAADSPPPWFTNRDDEPVVTKEEPASRRWIVAGVATLVILILVLIPIFQAAVLQRRQDSLPDRAFDRAALQFASAVLFARSEGQAMIFADESASDDVAEVVAFYRDTPPYSSQARIQIGATPCPARNEDAEICFLGRLFDPRSGISPAIEFGVGERDGEPRVLFVQIDQTVVLVATVNSP